MESWRRSRDGARLFDREMVGVPLLALTGAATITFLSTANSSLQLGSTTAMRGRVMSLYLLVTVLASYYAALGVTVVAAEHRLERVVSFADLVVTCDGGRVGIVTIP